MPFNEDVKLPLLLGFILTSFVSVCFPVEGVDTHICLQRQDQEKGSRERKKRDPGESYVE